MTMKKSTIWILGTVSSVPDADAGENDGFQPLVL